MIARTEAVVLRSIPYGETSRIVSLYTRQMGTVSVIAKGARQPRSRFGSSLQPMSYVQAVFYYKSGRDLHTLSECSLAYPLNGLARNLERLTAGLRIVELTRYLLPDPDPNPQAFNLLLQSLFHLDSASARCGNAVLFYQLRLAGILGFEPDFDSAAVRRLDPLGGLLNPNTGAILPSDSTEGGIPASRGALRAFAICSRADIETVMRMELTPDQEQETSHLAEAFIRTHVADLYPQRAGQVIEQLFNRRPGDTGS